MINVSQLADALLMSGSMDTGNPNPGRGVIADSGGDAGTDAPSRDLAARHVLVPLDGSALAECTLPFAAAMASLFSARITLLRVLETPASPVDPVEWEIRRAEARRSLERLDTQLQAKHLQSAVVLLEGRAAEQIIEFAKHNHVDLMVLSSHGEGGLSGWALSSTIHKVVARAHTSVLIVPAYAAEAGAMDELHLCRILVPLDCSPRAECTLPLAAALGRAHDATLLLAHIVPEPEMPRRMPVSAEDRALADQLTERNRNEAERYLGQLRERLQTEGLKVETRLRISPQRARSIRTLAEEENADLILIAAHGYTGDPAERYGATTARLLHECGKPVLIAQDLPEAVHAVTAAEEAARSHPGH
jgi:nucleotide-binding universal stress UspA family protein